MKSKFYLYVRKRHTDLIMRYGIYDSIYEATKMKDYCEEVNTIDSWFIEEKQEPIPIHVEMLREC